MFASLFEKEYVIKYHSILSFVKEDKINSFNARPHLFPDSPSKKTDHSQQ